MKTIQHGRVLGMYEVLKFCVFLFSPVFLVLLLFFYIFLFSSTPRGLRLPKRINKKVLGKRVIFAVAALLDTKQNFLNQRV